MIAAVIRTRHLSLQTEMARHFRTADRLGSVVNLKNFVPYRAETWYPLDRGAAVAE
jgi:hypothetical protein